jgi:hypothetical protein
MDELEELRAALRAGQPHRLSTPIRVPLVDALH